MLRVDLTRAKHGMELATAVMHPHKPGHILLRPGFRLDEPAIHRLRDIGVRQLWVRFPALHDVINPADQHVSAGYGSLVESLGRVFDAQHAPAQPHIEYAEYAAAVRALVLRLKLDPHAAMLVGEMNSCPGSIAEHAGATCFLAMLMGIKLETYLLGERKRVSGIAAKHVESLGMGSLLHDVGLLKLPAKLRTLTPPPDAAELQLWRAHVTHGWRMVHDHVEPTAAAAVLHHHQAYDGTGFPALESFDGSVRPPKGHEIHVFARIVAVADRFDELRRAEPGLTILAVLRRLVDQARAHTIDPVVLKALVNIVPTFMPGSIVTLSTGQPAVVLEHNPLKPCRPKVRRVRCMEIPTGDSIDEEWLAEEIDLASVEGVHVTESDGQNIEPLLFEPLTPDEFDIRLIAEPGHAHAA